MAKFNVYINDFGHVRIECGEVFGYEFKLMTDGAVILDPETLVEEISRIDRECSALNSPATFWLYFDNDTDHKYEVGNIGEKGWIYVLYEKGRNYGWRQIGHPELYASLKDLLWDFGLIPDEVFDTI